MKKRAPSPAPSGPPVDPVDWIERAGANSDVLAALARRRLQRRRRSVAATAAVTCLVAFFAWQTHSPRARPVAALASTTVSVPPRQVLPDGSVVELKDDARIRIGFDAGIRRVELVGGTAYFQVAKDPARPFVVKVGSVDVRAIGTIFSIQRDPHHLEVLVTEGRVAVERTDPPVRSGQETEDAAPARTLATLDAGTRATVDMRPAAAPPKIETVSSAAIAASLTWRVPKLQFSETPLEQAIRMINEHSQVKLVLKDPSLGSLPLTGVLRADNLETLLEVIKDTYGITAEKKTSWEIILSGR
jgi:transmembrane sensor